MWPGPDAAERLDRLSAAADIAAGEPARTITGDLLDRLPEAVAELPRRCTVVVFHSAVLMYLDADRRQAAVDLFGSLPVRWISQEAPGVVPGVELDRPAGPERFVLALDGTPLALTAPHGGRIDWLG